MKIMLKWQQMSKQLISYFKKTQYKPRPSMRKGRTKSFQGYPDPILLRPFEGILFFFVDN